MPSLAEPAGSQAEPAAAEQPGSEVQLPPSGNTMMTPASFSGGELLQEQAGSVKATRPASASVRTLFRILGSPPREGRVKPRDNVRSESVCFSAAVNEPYAMSQRVARLERSTNVFNHEPFCAHVSPSRGLRRSVKCVAPVGADRPTGALWTKEGAGCLVPTHQPVLPCVPLS